MATAAKAATKVAKPATKPATKPAARSAAKSTTKPVAKPAVKSAPKPAAKSAARKPAAKAAVGPEQRRFYVEVAAYYIAERRGFGGGNPLEDWVQAEAEIDRLLRDGLIGG